MPLKRAALLPPLLAAVIAAAVAQQAPAPNGQAPASSPTAKPKVDEAALRYFAAQGDQRRLETEMARLRALYPDWTPPTDLSGAGPGVDPAVVRMWAMFAQGRFAELRREIAERQTAEPAWTPPSDLVAKLDEAEARRRLVNASDAGQWNSVIAVATEAPSLLVCGNVDILWRVAEAFARTDRASRARDAYAYVLQHCEAPSERLATMQKALALLPDALFDSLFGFERKAADGSGEFASIQGDRVRQRVGRAAQQPSLTISPDELATVERLAREGKTADDALLLGWYLYRHQRAGEAVDWFKSALDRGGGAKAAEGYALALSATGRALEALPVAYEWRDATPENKKAYTDIMVGLLAADPPTKLPVETLEKFVSFVNGTKSAEGAEALGWFAYNTGQIRTGGNWFKTSLDWHPAEAAAYGLALVRKRLGDRAGFEELVRTWRSRSPRIARLAGARAAGPDAAPADFAMRPAIHPRGAAATVEAAFASLEGQMLAVRLDGDVQPLSRDRLELRPAADVFEAEEVSDEEPAPVRPRVVAPVARVEGKRACAMTRPRPETMAPASALRFAWCLMDLDRPLEAIAYFDRVIAVGAATAKSEATYGKSLAYLRKGLTNDAAVAATEAPQSERRSAELMTQILTQRLMAFYRERRFTETLLTLDERAKFVPEQNDLMLVRGWSYFELGRYDEAEQVFRAVMKTGYSTEGARGLTAILERTKQVEGD